MASADSEHGHGIAYYRNTATTVLGPVSPPPGQVDLAWLDSLGLSDRAPEQIGLVLDKLRSDDRSRALAAETFAIRLSIHAGWVGTPVNSMHAGAWANDSIFDWAAYAAMRHLAEHALISEASTIAPSEARS